MVFTLYLSFNEPLTILNAVATYVIYCGKLKLKQNPSMRRFIWCIWSTAMDLRQSSFSLIAQAHTQKQTHHQRNPSQMKLDFRRLL